MRTMQHSLFRGWRIQISPVNTARYHGRRGTVGAVYSLKSLCLSLPATANSEVGDPLYAVTRRAWLAEQNNFHGRDTEVFRFVTQTLSHLQHLDRWSLQFLA